MTDNVVYECLAVVAVGGAVIAVVAWLTAWLRVDAQWRRATWRGALVALGGLSLAQLTGFAEWCDGVVATWTRSTGIAAVDDAATIRGATDSDVRGDFAADASDPGEATNVESPECETAYADNAPPTLGALRAALPVAGVSLVDEHEESRGIRGNDAAVTPPVAYVGERYETRRLLIGIWISGVMAVLVGVARGRVTLILLRRRATPANVDTLAIVDNLRATIGPGCSVRVLHVEQLTSPAAFGIWRPTIVLPLDFDETYSPAACQAILAHELAHLAARDPAWQLTADLLAAMLWWHPAAWLVRRRLKISAEAVADEAAVHVPDGPRQLAESLVQLGRQLTPGRELAWSAITGGRMRSGLARRVVHLLKLEHGAVRRSTPAQIRWVGVALLLFLMMVSVFGTAWARPGHTHAEGDTSMSALKRTWKQSLLGAALATLGSPFDESTAVAASPNDATAGAISFVAVQEDAPRDEPRERRDGEGERRDRPDRERAKERDDAKRDRPAAERRDPDRPAGDRPARERREGEPRDDPRPKREGGDRERSPERDANRARVEARMAEFKANFQQLLTSQKRLAEQLKALPDGANDKAAAIRKEMEQMQQKMWALEAEAHKFQAEHRPDPAPKPRGGDRERHLIAAVENLRAAGMHDLAEMVRREAGGRPSGERRREEAPRDEVRRAESRREAAGERELMAATAQLARSVAELNAQVKQIRGELNELRERGKQPQRQ